ncbi:hypothetical protein [Herbiconiux sp.]|uniref:hypothetical protein n=1 Tax=Herbiconiux sp. TaxID=1871186 RepID=UPI0025C65743|nr:hypothetical protein [Herbiconiux sp.]
MSTHPDPGMAQNSVDGFCVVGTAEISDEATEERLVRDAAAHGGEEQPDVMRVVSRMHALDEGDEQLLEPDLHQQFG